MLSRHSIAMKNVLAALVARKHRFIVRFIITVTFCKVISFDQFVFTESATYEKIVFFRMHAKIWHK